MEIVMAECSGNQGNMENGKRGVVDPVTCVVLAAYAELLKVGSERLLSPDEAGRRLDGVLEKARMLGLATGSTRKEPPASGMIDAKMQDGAVYAGLSPDTGEPMFTTPAYAPWTMKWKQAMEYAAKLDAHGHQDWRAPTKGELNVLF
jgi:hypothetical protein